LPPKRAKQAASVIRGQNLEGQPRQVAVWREQEPFAVADSGQEQIEESRTQRCAIAGLRVEEFQKLLPAFELEAFDLLSFASSA
jgi:hypothetical protein